MIEALVVILVGVVILAVTAAGINSLFRTSEIATEASNILLLKDRLKDFSNGKEHFAGVNNALAVRYKIVPANMTLSGNKIFNAWNGEVNLGDTDQGRNFFIDYYKVPPEACQKLILRLGQSGWERIQVNDTAIPANVSLVDIAKRCAGSGGNGNKMAFVSGPT